MRYTVDKQLKQICCQIVASNQTEKEWAEIESDDMFQVGDYEGGFDATEMMFCFSLYKEGKECWFQIPLADVISIYNEKKNDIEIKLDQ